MKAVIQPLTWGLALASALAMASAVALDLVIDTAQAAETHGHGAHDAAASAVAGEQWATDAPLRDGMTRMRQALATAQPGDATQPMGAAEATRLQHDIETNVSYLIANCKLPEAADAALHELLAGLIHGAGALSAPASRERGVQRIRASLQRYPELFAAPHWSEPPSPRN